MDKRRNKKYSNNWNNQKRDQFREVNNKKVFQFNKNLYENEEKFKESQKSIQEIKAREVICPFCNQPITDIASAMADRASGQPVHFDCVLNKIKADEHTGENEKIAYIGQGRFGLLYFENPRDQRHFKIKKIIEWEPRENKSEWRDELSALYSKVN